MNYIKEINAFYIKMETESLSAGAVSLWHSLIHVNNRAGWLKEFTVAAAVLCYKSGLSESGFRRARAELRDKGYITFVSRGTKAPVYKLNSCVIKARYDEVDASGSQESVSAQAAEESEASGGDKAQKQFAKAKREEGEKEEGDKEMKERGKKAAEDVAGLPALDVAEGRKEDAAVMVGALSKQNGTRQDNKQTTTSSSSSRQRIFSSLVFYRDHFQVPTTYINRQLKDWIQLMGDELVVQALKRTLDQGKEWPYAVGILKRWQAKELFTLDAVLVSEREFRRKRMQGSFGAGKTLSQSTEIVPEWFTELKEKEREKAREKERGGGETEEYKRSLEKFRKDKEKYIRETLEMIENAHEENQKKAGFYRHRDSK